MRSEKTLGVLVFYGVVVTVALILLLARFPSGEEYAPPELTTILGARLGELVERSRFSAPRQLPSPPPMVAWSYGLGCDSFRGMAAFHHAGGGEAQIWWRAQPEERRYLRHPQRRPLPGLTLLRDPLRSEIVPSDSPARGWFALVVEEAGEERKQLLINNFAGRQALPLAAEVNRGLASLTAAKGCNFHGRDSETVETLMAVLRISFCSPEESAGCYPSAMVLYRDSKADMYRLDGQALQEDCGQLALRMRVDRGPDGLPSAAGMEVLQRATVLRCRVRLDAITPAPPGEPDHRREILRVGPEGGVERVRLELAPLLAGTGWR